MTTSNSGNDAAIISAFAGICGVLLGSLLSTIKDVLLATFARERETRYLAILVASHLDRFASGCLAVACDDGTHDGEPAGDDEEPAPVVMPPTLELLDLDVNWKALDPGLMAQTLLLPDQLRSLKEMLSSDYYTIYEDRGEFMLERRSAYGRLGLEALSLSSRLRKAATLPVDISDRSRHNLSLALKQEVDNVESKRKAAREKHSAAEFGA